MTGNSGADGGGIAVFYGAYGNGLRMARTTISDNTATARGGGIYVDGDIDLYSPRVNNSTITGNSATTGGGIHDDSGQLELRNATVTGNTASTQVGGVFFGSNPEETLESNIIAENTATNAGPDRSLPFRT